MPESKIAPYLGELQTRVKKEGIRIGSCTWLTLPQANRQTRTSTRACT